MHDDILTKKVDLPNHISKPCKSLLKGLLEKNPDKRLGWKKKGIEEIKQHKFFKPINWKDILEKKLEVPVPAHFEIKSRDFPPNEVFGDYDDFESDFNLDNWSFCKTILDNPL